MLFPKMFESPFAESIVARARAAGKLSDLVFHDLRSWAGDRHLHGRRRPVRRRRGHGLHRPSRSAPAIRELKGRDGHVVLLSAQGRLFDEPDARAGSPRSIISCWSPAITKASTTHRRERRVDEEPSIGDYVVTGGELPAMVKSDAVALLLPAIFDVASLHVRSRTRAGCLRDRVCAHAPPE